jgi:tetratricopeptide (TPR) repeat protein
VQTKSALPQAWAATQNNLGAALWEQAGRSAGAQALDLLAQAVQAFRAALEVRTRANLPQDWAKTEVNLAAVLDIQGVRSSGTRATDLLTSAVEAYRAGLEVYTKADLPQNWATTQNNLGATLMALAERSSDAQATDLLAQAADAFRATMEVETRADLPLEWAHAEANLGLALRNQGERSHGAQARELFAQAIQADRAALEIYTRKNQPLDWARIENNLANALVDQQDFPAAATAIDAALEAAPDNTSFLQTAVSIYHDNLYRYDRAYELAQHWLQVDSSPDAKFSLAEQDLTTSRFEDCAKLVATIGDAALPAPAISMAMIRDSFKLTCQWGAGQKADAQQTAQALSLKASQLLDVDWEFTGTRHFLASSPAFAQGRASWIALFDSLEKGDGLAMATALHQLQEVMKP